MGKTFLQPSGSSQALVAFVAVTAGGWRCGGCLQGRLAYLHSYLCTSTAPELLWVADSTHGSVHVQLLAQARPHNTILCFLMIPYSYLSEIRIQQHLGHSHRNSEA